MAVEDAIPENDPPTDRQISHEHGGEYEPDAFGALDSLEDLQGESPAVGCMLAYIIVVIAFLAELLRYATGSAIWWPILITIPFFFPRVWAAFRLWQSPQLMDGPALKHLNWRDRRLWLGVAVVLMIAEFQLRLFWPTIRNFFDRAW